MWIIIVFYIVYFFREDFYKVFVLGNIEAIEEEENRKKGIKNNKNKDEDEIKQKMNEYIRNKNEKEKNIENEIKKENKELDSTKGSKKNGESLSKVKKIKSD